MTFEFPPPVPQGARRMRAVPVTVVVILLVLSFALGTLTASRSTLIGQTTYTVSGTHQAPPAGSVKNLDFSLFWNVWDYVHKNSLDRPIQDQKLLYGSIAGMVAGLEDPYSIFMDPETAQKFGEDLEGAFDGIGAEIGIRDNRLVIIAPLPGTPADRAGLKAGDRILGINDLDTTGMSVDYAVNQIRGERGTKVKLHVLSTGESEPREVSITRDRILIQAVQGEIKELPGGRGNIAYIKIVHFSQDTDQKFREVWQALEPKGPKAIVLDLRNNPGGYLEQAVAISSHWVKSGGVVVRERLAPPEEHQYESQGAGELSAYLTVVLVNGGSASASEIVTGALQDLHLATIVGEKTFGKGSVQDLKDFPDGSAVKLTIAKWYTPNDRSIHKNGLLPDVEVKITKTDVEANKDPQLTKALELLAR